MNIKSAVRLFVIGAVLTHVLAGASLAQGFWKTYKAAFGNAFLNKPDQAFRRHTADRILTHGARASAAVGIAAGAVAGGPAAASAAAANAKPLIMSAALLAGSAAKFNDTGIPAQFVQGAGRIASGPTAQKAAEMAPRVIQAIGGK